MNTLIRFVRRNAHTLCQRMVALALAFAMLGNLTLEAVAVPISRLEQQVTSEVQKQITHKQTPQRFLQEVKQELENLLAKDNSATPALSKQTKEEFARDYKRRLESFYEEEESKLLQEANGTLADFDVAAKEAYDKEANSLQEYKNELSAEAVAFAEKHLAEYQSSLKTKREEYKREIDAQLQTFRSELAQEKTAQLDQWPQAYTEYEKEYDAALREMEGDVVLFYRDLVHQIVENYKKTDDIKSKQAFVSIITYISSFNNKDQIFTGQDRTFIQQALWSNFTVKADACHGRVQTIYSDDSTWGSAGMGGSPSAGRSFDRAQNAKQIFKLDNETRCNLAISSLIPFANLNGEGYKIANFVQANMDNPLFGSILLVGAKALLITSNGNMTALDNLIGKAIEKENSGRKKTFWQSLDVYTGEGLIKNLSFDGNYFAHNVSSSAQRNPGEPNVWEDVAYLLAQNGTPQAKAILNKAVAQCAVRTHERGGRPVQGLSCQGIYPFLFGVLRYAPELTENLKVSQLLSTIPGLALERDGRTRVISEAEAEKNRQYNEQNDVLKKVSRGELLGGFFYGQWFNDLYPADRLRIDNIVASSAVLNKSGSMKAYSFGSEEYKKIVNKFNIKTVFVAVGSMFDYIISLYLIRDIGLLGVKVGALTKNVSKVMKFRQVVLEYKHIPNSTARSILMANALKAKGIDVAFVARLNKIKFYAKGGKPRQVIHQFTSGVVERFREANAQRFNFEPPQVVYESPFKQAAAQKGATFTQRPFSYRAAAREIPPVGGMGATSDASKGIKQLWQEFKSPFQKAWKHFSPFGKSSAKGGEVLGTENLTVKLLDKNGKPVKIETISLTGDGLIINGEMAKTYKTYMPLEHIDTLAQFLREKGTKLGFQGLWVKLVDSQAKVSKWEAWRGRNHVAEIVPLFDKQGLQIMAVGLNRGYKTEAALLDKIAGGARLVFADGKLYLSEDGALSALSQFDGISIPKTAMTNMAKAKDAAFFEQLFSLKDTGKGTFTMHQTGSKLFWPMAINVLSFSAASTSLMMTFEREPFEFSPAMSIGLGLALPYMSGFAAPFIMPFVNRYGARNIMALSLTTASATLGVAMLAGYRGEASYEKDKNGKVIRDENGKPKLRETKPPVWPLIMTAGLTGLASTGIRATSNMVLKAYELNQRTLNQSMIWKSVGGMAFTLVPYLYFRFGAEKDFSATYPYLAGISLLTAGGLMYKMPKMPKYGYSTISKKDFSAPWKLFGRKEVWPYVAGIAMMSSLEGYVYFKGLNAFARDVFGSKEGDKGFLSEETSGNFLHGFIEKNPSNAKFYASLVTAIPQITMRKWSPRKMGFGKGMFNSALLATAGTGLLMLPTEESSVINNVLLGAASGILVGFGTAQVFQYNQKLMVAAVKTLPEGENLVNTAITLHSMGNVGFVLPTIFGFVADKRKEKYGENDFFSTQRTFPYALGTYGTGLGLIALAEYGLVKKAGKMARIALTPVKAVPPIALGTIGTSTLLNIPQHMEAQPLRLHAQPLPFVEDEHLETENRRNFSDVWRSEHLKETAIGSLGSVWTGLTPPLNAARMSGNQGLQLGRQISQGSVEVMMLPRLSTPLPSENQLQFGKRMSQPAAQTNSEIKVSAEPAIAPTTKKAGFQLRLAPAVPTSQNKPFPSTLDIGADELLELEPAAAN
ncbi:MAG: apolipoprotein A1/A4/E family protein [Elusimicrobiaceae bacterium]|nr:apolipoprotein A1/A4/E family protein [Elusimicrobiaceae bacterium]